MRNPSCYLLIFAAMLTTENSFANSFKLQIERCYRNSAEADNAPAWDCSEITQKNLPLARKANTAFPMAVAAQKRNLLRHEHRVGNQQITIGAWKPDSFSALTRINVSLTEEGRGQLDYNEASFFDDRPGGFLEISLRGLSSGEFYRVKLFQEGVLDELERQQLPTYLGKPERPNSNGNEKWLSSNADVAP